MDDKKVTLGDAIREVRENITLYMHLETKMVGPFHILYDSIIGREHDENKLISNIEELGLLELPRYKEIDHKSIMSFYVKEYVEDKEIRQKLFYILRNHDYCDKFIDAIKELDLYDDYLMVTDDLYNQIANEWLEKNKISLQERGSYENRKK